MSFTKWCCFTEHRRICIKDDLYIVYHGRGICTPYIITLVILDRIAITVKFIIQFGIRFPVFSNINIVSTILQINLRMCTLKQISINRCITKAYGFLTNKYTYLIGAPHTNDGRSCRCSLLCTAASIFLNIYHVSISNTISLALCHIFRHSILINHYIICRIIYLLSNHIVHAIIGICIQLIFCRFRLYHFIHDIVHSKLTVISQPVIKKKIFLHIRCRRCHCRQRCISSGNNFIFIFCYCKLSTQII